MTLERDPGPLLRFFWKRLEKIYINQYRKRELEWRSLRCNFEFSAKCETAFRFRRRERIEVQAIHFVAVCVHFALSLLHCFLVVFGPLRIPELRSSAAEVGPLF